MRGWLAFSVLPLPLSFSLSFSFFVDGFSVREIIPRSHCRRYRLAPNGPDKEKQKNIFSSFEKKKRREKDDK
jgi:hypothetical protein